MTEKKFREWPNRKVEPGKTEGLLPPVKQGAA
jgi:hypothetical protein